MRRQRELQAQAAAAQAAQTPVETVAQAPAQVIASRPLLMLPAPVVDPVMAQINQLAAFRVARAAGVERQGEGRFSATPVR